MKVLPIAVVTSCTKRKRNSVGRPLLGRAKSGEALGDFAARWISEVRQAPQKMPARDIYVGRGISEVRKIAEDKDADTYIVSAGMGLVAGSYLIPNYNLTVSNGSGSVLRALHAREASAQDWWSALATVRGRPNPLANLIRRNSRGAVLVALPSTYLELVRGDLEGLSLEEAAPLRIFTTPSNRELVPKHLRAFVLPYDERLEASDFAGTRGDFPQRALAHFATHILRPNQSLSSAKRGVGEKLQGLTVVKRPIRKKKTDEQIIDLLIRKWSAHEGRSVRALRFLRDEALVQCEQGRFKSLWKIASSHYAA